MIIDIIKSPRVIVSCMAIYWYQETILYKQSIVTQKLLELLSSILQSNILRPLRGNELVHLIELTTQVLSYYKEKVTSFRDKSFQSPMTPSSAIMAAWCVT